MFTTVLSLALVLSFLPMSPLARPEVVANSDRPCFRYDGDGCSVPFGLPFFFKTQFTPSCDRHDICYHCGVAYSISKATCDQAFRHDTLSSCTSSYMATQSGLTSDDKIRVIQIAERFGHHAMKPIMEREISALLEHHPTPSRTDFIAWFDREEVQIRLVADWIAVMSSAYAQNSEQKVSKGSDPLWFIKTRENYSEDEKNLKFLSSLIKNPNVGINKQSKPDVALFKVSVPGATNQAAAGAWCSEILAQVKSHNQTIPPHVQHCASISYLTCDLFSTLYYLAVAIFGGSSYHREPEFYCHESFVPGCLPRHAIQGLDLMRLW